MRIPYRSFLCAIALCTTLFSTASSRAADAALPEEDPASDASHDELRIGSQRVGRVLFLGNSITQHGPAPSIGWLGNYGMAATAEENDYVHVLTRRIGEAAGRTPEIMVQNIADFERELSKYDLNAGLAKAFAFQADLVVVAIGENVAALDTEAKQAEYRESFTRLLDELQQHGKPTLVVRSSFWANPPKDTIMQEVCASFSGVFVDIHELGSDEKNKGKSERNWEHPGVADHPGDRGMKAIADAIWKALAARAESTE